MKHLLLPEESRFRGCGEEERSFLSRWHREAWLDFAIAHQNWTVDDWKQMK